MVTVRAGESGKGKLGCIFTLVIIVAVFYYGIDFLRVRFRYYQIQDEVKTQASFAPALDDITIRRRLVAKADSLGLPLGDQDWTIRRTGGPRSISISAAYTDSVVISFPGIRKVFYFNFTPSAYELY
ncbi:MAG TPA: hypothetical protein VGI92_14170 [Gemmatimonadales bacterium]